MADKQDPINFFKEEIKFTLSKREKLREWIKRLAKKEKHTISGINYIFCNDKYLRKINKSYLQHDYFTDIITFDNSLVKNEIVGDIFISVDRVKINAKSYHLSFEDELHRVMIHGVLHLLGYGDKNEKQKRVMREMENKWLEERKF